MQDITLQLNIFWVLFCGVLVLLMQAGFLCLESGVTRSKNSINVALKNAADFILSFLLFWAVGFGIMFGDTLNGWVGSSGFFVDFSNSDGWTAALFIFQAMFCATTVTIVSGAAAERLTFKAYLYIAALLSLLIYPVAGHWSWGNILQAQSAWLSELGFVDFAGSTVVHSTGGWVALMTLLLIGPRRGRFVNGKPQPISPSSAQLACLGMLFFVIGWIGFNGGSTLALNHQVPGIIGNTLLAAASGAATAALAPASIKPDKGSLWVIPLNGALAGMVAITANCHVVSALESVIIGSVGAVVMLIADWWMMKRRIDDALAAVPIHLGAGIWGTLAVALFGDPDSLATGLSRSQQLLAQCTGIVAIGIWACLISLVFLYCINRITPLRVTAEAEDQGLNVSEHGARSDLIDLVQALETQRTTLDLDHRAPVEPFTEVGQIASSYNRVMEALATAVNQTRAIVHDIRDAIVTFGDDLAITSFNPGAEQIFQLSAAEALGRDFRQLIDALPQDDKGKPLLKQSHAVIGRRPDQSTFHVELTLTHGLLNNEEMYTALCRDVSEKRAMEEQLFQEKEQALVTLSSIADGVITTDVEARIMYLNDPAQQMTGWSAKEAQNQPCREVFDLKSTAVSTSELIAQALRGETVRIESDSATLLRREAEPIGITCTAAPIRNREGAVVGGVIVFHDVSLQRDMQKKLSHQATHDALTGFYNRIGFENIARVSIEDAETNQTQHTMAYLDLDQFKLVNDSCGHVAGDELLRQIAAVISQQLRSGDTIARLGGDEFGVILHNCPKQAALNIAENIRHAIQNFRFAWEGRTFSIGVSIGMVQINHQSPGLEKLLSLADSACYAAKDQGRNRVHLYEPDDLEMSIRQGQIQWVSKIRQALDSDQLRLFYQPIVDISQTNAKNSPPAHIEIFVRMQEPDGKIIPPGAFIPAAERYNLIQEIDLWVIKNTLAWLGDLSHSETLNLGLCAMNISGPTLSDENCLSKIIDFIDYYRVPADKVCFEITETAAITNLNHARTFFGRLRKQGCHFALDDFGSGLSSFGYLKNLPVQYLKIDGSFIKHIHENTIDSVMVQSINQIGHEMGLKTIAEFVESEDILEHLKTIGIDFAQGYYLGKPQPLEALSNVAVMPR